MGSFFGHVLPGSFFILFALWHIIQVFRRYFQSFTRGSTKEQMGYSNTVTFPILTRRGWVQLDAYVITVCCGIGLFVELVAATIKNHNHVGTANIQHGTMYFFFGLTALCAIILPKLKVIPNCDDVIYLLMALSYIAEGLLFKFHLFGREGVDVLLHTLLYYAIFAAAIVTLIEMRNRNNIMISLSRAFLTMLQGTWFWQAAFVLYPPLTDPWGHNSPSHQDGMDMHDSGDKTDHHYLMFLTCVFTWHMAVIFIFMLVCGVCIGCFYKRKGYIDEEALMNRHYSHNPQSSGYRTLQQNGHIQEDEL